MKLLKWISLGIAIWAASLVWPEINLGLTGPVVVSLMALSGLGLMLVGLLALLEQHLDRSLPPAIPSAPARHAHSTRPMLSEVIRHNTGSRPTRPVAI